MKKKTSREGSSTLRLQVVIEIDEDGKYVASCPALQGCHAQGDTFEEALRNVQDVIDMCIEELKDEHRLTDLSYPEVVGIKTVEVSL